MNLLARHRFSPADPSLEQSRGLIFVPFWCDATNGQYACAEEAVLHQLAKQLWTPPTIANSDEEHNAYGSALIQICMDSDIAVVYADADCTVRTAKGTLGVMYPLSPEEWAAIENRSQQQAH